MDALHAVSRDKALEEIADTPATLEFRAVALDPRGAVYRSGGGLVVVDSRDRLVGALGPVVAGDVVKLLEGKNTDCELVADRAAHERLRGVCHFERAILHTLSAPWQSAERAVSGLLVRPLAPSDSLSHLPDELRRQIERELPLETVFAGFIECVAVSFAYCASYTETLGDVAIDTLAEHRNRGIGAAVVSALVDRIEEEGKSPVWGAVESNQASLRLAAKLGFTPIAGELFVWE